MKPMMGRWKTRLLVVIPALAVLLSCTAPEPNPTDPAKDLLVQINAYREARGLSAVSRSPKLEAAASFHNADMAARNYFAHAAPDGSSLRDRLEAQGYTFRFAAENLAGGQRTAREVLEAWQDSPGHDANLLAPRATEAGIAFSRNPAGEPIGWLWTLVLAAPMD